MRLGDHECINALAARYALETGEWLIPRLADQSRVRKTPLGIWLIAASSWLMDPSEGRPVSEFSARLPSALAAMILVLLTAWLGSMMFGQRVGLVAGFITAASVFTLGYARNAQVDMVLTMLTTLSMAFFYRLCRTGLKSPADWMAFSLALAAAMMAKAPLPLVIVGLAAVSYWFLVCPLLEGAADSGRNGLGSRYLCELRGRCALLWAAKGRVLASACLFIALSAAWPVYVYFKVPGALELWGVEYVDRFSGDMSTRADPIWYYLPIVFGFCAPFLLSLPEALVAPFLARYRAYRSGLLLAFCWAAAGTLFLSLASYKRPHYLLSVMPAYMLLLAPVIDRLFFGTRQRPAHGAILLKVGIPLALLVGIIVGAQLFHQEFPGMMRVYAFVGGILVLLWSLAVWAYVAGSRAASFGLLLAGMGVGVTLGWPATARHLRLHGEGERLAERLASHGVPRDAEIYQVVGRPDATVEFYSGYALRRLFTEMEMARLRGNRTSEPGPELLQAFAGGIREKLAADRPVYLVFEAGWLTLLQRKTDIQVEVLFALEGFHPGEPGEELVVVARPGVHTPTSPLLPVGRNP